MDQLLIHNLFEYNNGYLIWKVSPAKCVKVGKTAGTLLKDGYIAIRYLGKGYKAHRLIWIYHFGDIPCNKQIDHIDGNRQNNKIENLRIVSAQENLQNKHFVKGYILDKRRNRYFAQIELDGKKYWLGYFDTKELAKEAYFKAKKELHHGYSTTSLS